MRCVYVKHTYIYTSIYHLLFHRNDFHCRGAKGALLDKAVEIVAAWTTDGG